MNTIEPPLGLVAELTHRCSPACPACGTCGNGKATARGPAELTTAQWQDVFEQAAELGVLQLHVTGGEPSVRDDLAELVATARSLDLYVNLITSGLLLDRTRIDELVDAGVDHVQLNVESADPDRGDAHAGIAGAHSRKLLVARWVQQRHVPLTINVVLNRDNVRETPALIELAVELGAGRLELTYVQQHGLSHSWSSQRRAAPMPDAGAVRWVTEVVRRAQANLDRPLEVDYVAPDDEPRRLTGQVAGWGQSLAVVTPTGNVLPCRAAATKDGLEVDNVRDRDLANIWFTSSAFARFRAVDRSRTPYRTYAPPSSDLRAHVAFE